MATKNTTAPRLEVRGIRKTFGQNAVLKGINLSVDAGEVVALIGGNGAGKSTLMKIIMGIYTCDEGDILIDGQAVKLGKPAASLAQGIYLVPQEPMLFPNMTVLENILMGFSENEGELKKRLNECMKELNFDLNLQRKANTLSIAEQQLVELLRGMMRNARILILDEPTSSPSTRCNPCSRRWRISKRRASRSSISRTASPRSLKSRPTSPSCATA